MSLLDNIKQKFSEMKIGQKLAAIVLIPMAILALLFKLIDSFRSLSENSKRDEADKKSKDMDEKIKETNRKASMAEGKLQALQEAKEKSIEASDKQDSVSFHNSRKK